ncbi:MAG: SDR family NAD(P)-dependent oxidoreductase [Spirosomataceae bacterium]
MNVFIVTGGSSGIGFELANQLADVGFNLIIHARHLEKLQEAGSKIKINIEC